MKDERKINEMRGGRKIGGKREKKKREKNRGKNREYGGELRGRRERGGIGRALVQG